ncbi:glycosyltransferase family 2 protein [Streptomyces sp. NPDC046215]|uniref:4,4'-diaponeurosporenoate glycosyltransferase n=1 Tax=Streptomyces stramineus TaxID=173861 RepID=A0ABN1AMN5_9ACTN
MTCPDPVTVVVAVRGTPQELPGLFAHLAVQTYLGEIDVVVVDHGPRPVIDATALRRWWVPTRVVHEPRPGLPHAHNTGIEAATGRWILITSPDAMPAPDWVRAMVSALTHSGASLAGGRVLPQFTAARPPALPPDVLSLFMPTHWPQTPCELESPYELSGCNLGMPRAEELRFDHQPATRGPRHPRHGARELALRVQKDGRLATVVPGAVVYRNIRPQDLTMRALWKRARWHQVPVSRVLRPHPHNPAGLRARLGCGR